MPTSRELTCSKAIPEICDSLSLGSPSAYYIESECRVLISVRRLREEARQVYHGAVSKGIKFWFRQIVRIYECIFQRRLFAGLLGHPF